MNINNEISVVIATYNGSDFIREQIDSILRGITLPFEIIIVDDNSTDNTINILEEIASNISIIKIYKNEVNLGAHETFKKAIRHTTGTYIVPCDQDDIWEDNHIDILYKTIKERNCDLVFGQDRIMYEDGEIVNQTLKFNGIEKIIFGNNIPGHLQMFHRRCIDVYTTAPNVTFDWGSVLYAVVNNGIVSVDDVICTWRRHKNVVTSAYTKNYKQYKNINKNKYYKTISTIFKLASGIKSNAIKQTMYNNFIILNKYSNTNTIKNYAKVCKYISKQNVFLFIYASILYAINVDLSNYAFRKKIGAIVYSLCYPFVWWYDYHPHRSL